MLEYLVPPRCIIDRVAQAGFNGEDRAWVYDPSMSDPHKAAAYYCPCRPKVQGRWVLLYRVPTALGIVRVGQCEKCGTLTWAFSDPPGIPCTTR